MGKRYTAEGEQSFWRGRLEQCILLLKFLEDGDCECLDGKEARDFILSIRKTYGITNQAIICILCYASNVLEDKDASIGKLKGAYEEVVCHIDDFGIVSFSENPQTTEREIREAAEVNPTEFGIEVLSRINFEVLSEALAAHI
jgi:hypothetical protein